MRELNSKDMFAISGGDLGAGDLLKAYVMYEGFGLGAENWAIAGLNIGGYPQFGQAVGGILGALAAASLTDLTGTIYGKYVSPTMDRATSYAPNIPF